MRFNPYQALKQQFSDFCAEVTYRHRKTMWRYPKESLGSNWKLDDLYQRTLAAQQLDCVVELVADEQGITVQYVAKIKTPIL